MFEGYRKYLLVRYAHDTGTDDGADYDTLKAARSTARAYRAEGDDVVICIDTQKKRIAFVSGDRSVDIYSLFSPDAAALLFMND